MACFTRASEWGFGGCCVCKKQALMKKSEPQPSRERERETRHSSLPPYHARTHLSVLCMLLPHWRGAPTALAAARRAHAPMPPRAAAASADAAAATVTVCAATEGELEDARAVLGTVSGGGREGEGEERVRGMRFFVSTDPPSSAPQDSLATSPSTTASLTYAPPPPADAAPFFAALTTRRLGRVLVTADELPSTQALLQSAAGRAPPGLIVVAASQTAGKGRGANAWTSPVGCLAASLSTRIDVSGTRLPFVQYVVSLAVLAAARAELVAAVADAVRVEGEGEEGAAHLAAARAAAATIRIKWPNDVYLGGGKLAGVLCHSW